MAKVSKSNVLSDKSNVLMLLLYLCGSACGLQVQYGSVSTVGGEGAEWSTVSVNLTKQSSSNNRNYINVNNFFIMTMKFSGVSI